MGKALFRMTGSELQKLIEQKVVKHIYEHLIQENGGDLFLQNVAQAVMHEGTINAINGHNEIEVSLGDTIVMVSFDLESAPMRIRGMQSHDYDVPDDPDEVQDDIAITNVNVSTWDDMDDESVIPDNGLVQDALYKVIDIEYNMGDMPYRDEL